MRQIVLGDFPVSEGDEEVEVVECIVDGLLGVGVAVDRSVAIAAVVAAAAAAAADAAAAAAASCMAGGRGRGIEDVGVNGVVVATAVARRRLLCWRLRLR